MPGSRAVLGGLLVAGALVGLFAAANRPDRGEGTYVVARRAVASGSRLAATDLATTRLRLSPALRRRAFDQPAKLAGATLLSALAPGELVQASVVTRGTGEQSSREVSFTVDRGRIGPDLAGGELVDIAATYGTGDQAFTAVVVRQARVMSLDRSRGGLADGPTVVTLGLNDVDDALALAHATTLGKVTVVRANRVAPDTGQTSVYRPSPMGAR